MHQLTMREIARRVLAVFLSILLFFMSFPITSINGLSNAYAEEESAPTSGALDTSVDGLTAGSAANGSAIASANDTQTDASQESSAGQLPNDAGKTEGSGNQEAAAEADQAPSATYDLFLVSGGEAVGNETASADGKTIAATDQLALRICWSSFGKVKAGKVYTYALPSNLVLSDDPDSAATSGILYAPSNPGPDYAGPSGKTPIGTWSIDASNHVLEVAFDEGDYTVDGTDISAKDFNDVTFTLRMRLFDDAVNALSEEDNSVIVAFADNTSATVFVDMSTLSQAEAVEAANELMTLAAIPTATVPVEFKMFWVDNSNSDKTRPAESAVKSMVSLNVYDKDTGAFIKTVSLPNDAVYTVDASNAAKITCNMPATDQQTGQALKYEPFQDDEALKALNPAYVRGDGPEPDVAYNYLATSIDVNVKAYEGYDHNDPLAGVTDALALTNNQGAPVTASPGWSFDASTNTGVVTYDYLQKYTLNGTEVEYRVSLPVNGSSVTHTTVVTKEGDYLNNGGYQYLIEYDNSAVPNHSADTTDCVDGGTIVLTRKGGTSYASTKYWLDANSADRPTTTFLLWRFTDKGAGQTGYKQASPVYDTSHNQYSITIDGTQEGISSALNIAATLEQYDAEGYPYIYLLRENITGGNATYEQVNTDVVIQGGQIVDLKAETLPAGITRDATDNSIYNGGTVANRIKDSETVKTTKSWVANAYIDGLTNVTVTMTLKYRVKGSGQNWQIVSDPSIVNPMTKGGFCGSVTSQDFEATVSRYNQLGQELEYMWDESAIAENGTPVTIQNDQYMLSQNVKNSYPTNPYTEVIDGVTFVRTNYERFTSIDDGSGTIKNVLTGECDYVTHKTWVDANGNDISASKAGNATAKMTLVGDDGSTREFTLDGIPSDRTDYGDGSYCVEEPAWFAHFENLPKYDKNGARITYHIMENNTQSATISHNAEQRFDSVVNGSGTGLTATVTKKWIDGGDDVCRYPSKVKLVYWPTGEQPQDVPNSEITLDTTNGWIDRISVDKNFLGPEPGQPGHDPKKWDIGNYHVKEVSVGSFAVEDSNNYGDATFTDGTVTTDKHMYVISSGREQQAGNEVLNVSDRRVGTVDVQASKVWNDEGANTSLRPQLQFVLKVDSGSAQIVSSTDPTQGSVSVAGVKTVKLATVYDVDRTAASGTAGVTYYTFNGLPKYDASGTPITYTVEEQWVTPPSARNDYVMTSFNETYTPNYQPPTPATSGTQTTGVAAFVASLFAAGNANTPSTEERDQLLVDVVNGRSATEDVVFYKEWNDAWSYAHGTRPDMYVELYHSSDVPETSGQAAQITPDYAGFRENNWTADDRSGRTDAKKYWKIVFEDQPKYTADGKLITYYALESVNGSPAQFDYTDVKFMNSALNVVTESDPGYWVEKAKSSNKLVVKQGGTFLNNTEADTSLEGKKVWEYIPGQYTGEVPNISVTVMAKTTDETTYHEYIDPTTQQAVTLPNMVTPTGDRTIKFSFGPNAGPTTMYHYDIALPKYDSNGKLYQYTFKEVISNAGNRTSEITLDGLYTSTVDVNLVAHNIFDKQLTSLKLTKNWTNRASLVGTAGEFSYPTTTFTLHRVYTDTKGVETEDTPKTVTITAAEWTRTQGAAVIDFGNDIPVYAPDGYKYIYYVTEQNISGYDFFSSGLSTATNITMVSAPAALVAKNAFTFNGPNSSGSTGGSVENKYIPESADLTGAKAWNDFENAFGTRPVFAGDPNQPNFAALGMKLYRSAASQPGQNNAIAEQEVVLTLADWNWAQTGTGANLRWQYTVKDLPKWAPNGMQWTYRVEENLASPYDTIYAPDKGNSRTATWATDHFQVADITNSFNNSATFKKTWEAEPWAQHPTVVAELQFRFAGETTWNRCADTAPFSTTGQTYTATIVDKTPSTSGTASINNLPRLAAKGTQLVPVEYRFVEVEVKGARLFTSSATSTQVADNGSNYLQLINPAVRGNGRYVPVSQSTAPGTGTTLYQTTIQNDLQGGYVSLKVKKYWLTDEAYKSFTRPSSVVFKLQSSTDGATWSDVKDNNNVTRTVTVSASSWETTVNQLPNMDDNGLTLRYRAVETNVPPSYTQDPNDPTSSFDAQTKTWNSETTNTLQTVDFGGDKIWIAPNRTFTLAETQSLVNLTLYRYTDADPTKRVVDYGGVSGKQPEWYVSSTSNQFEFKYASLPKLDSSGNAYHYTVEEKPAVNGFVPSYTTTPATTVTNKATELQLDKVNDRTNAQIFDDKLELTVKDSNNLVIATWKRGASATTGTFAVTPGLTGKYANVYATGTNNSRLLCLPYGQYTISETGTPDDYKTAADTTVTISASTTVDSPATKTVRDVPKPSTIALSKYDSNTGNFLLGATFTVTKAEDPTFSKTMTYYGTWSQYVLEDLDVGTYTVKETTVPKGYQSGANDFECTFKLTDADKNKTFDIKQGTSTSAGPIQLVSGSWYGTSGVANTPRVLGVNKVVGGTDLNHDKLELTVSRNGATVFTWKRNAQGVVTVNLVAKTGDFANAYVGSDNRVYAIPAGDYVISETGDMPEYAWAKAATVTIANDGSATLKVAGDATLDASTVTVAMDNHLARGKATLKKEIAGGKSASKEITFSLYKQLGSQPNPTTDELVLSGQKTNAAGLWSTDDNPSTKDGLYVGKYYFIETQANPQTLLNTTPYTFEITKYHDIKNGTIPQGVSVTMTNTAFNAAANWLKTDYYEDSTALTKLLSADFDLYAPNGTKVNVVYSATAGYSAILSMKGTYTLIETTPPAGYPAGGKNACVISFAVDDADQDSIIRLYDGATTSVGAVSLTQGTWNKDGGAIGNVKATGELNFTKLVLVNETCSAQPSATKPLAGAEFTIYTDSACTTVAKTYDGRNCIATSDANGAVHFDMLLAGTYYMKETVFPANVNPAYVQAVEPFIIDVSGTGAVLTSVLTTSASPTPIDTITNDYYRADLNLLKVSELDSTKPIEGAEYSIYRSDDLKTPIATAITDKNGKLAFDGLIAEQEYVLKETRAPEGTLLSAEVFTITFKNVAGTLVARYASSTGAATYDDVTATVTWNEPITQVEIDKVTVDGALLAGAKLHIEDENGNVVVEQWTSGADKGQLVTGVLVAGKKYFLVEDESPSGYKQLEAPYEFVVDATPRGFGESYIQVVKVANNKVDALTKTGDGLGGMVPFAVLAGALSAGLLAVAVRRNRRGGEPL